MKKSSILFTVFLAALNVLDAYSQISPGCSFGCNDTINVSVNRDCEALVTADVVLDGYDFSNCPSPPLPRIYNAQGQQISNLITRQYIGQYLRVEISSPTQGTCGGYIKVEDKLSPVLLCPSDDTLRCDAFDYAATNEMLEDSLKRLLERTLVDNCGNEDLRILILENRLSKDCDRQFSATRGITFVALDEHNNADTCSFMIFYEGVPPLSVNAPHNFTRDSAISCTHPFPVDKDGTPYPTVQYMLERYGGRSMPNINGRPLGQLVNGIFIPDNLCNFKMSYSDQTIPHCGGAYKIIRNWRVIDWCNNNVPVDFYQIIKVEDRSVKIVKCGIDQQIAASGSSCSATALLWRPEVGPNKCSEWKWTISVLSPKATQFETAVSGLSSLREGYNHTFDIGTSIVKYYVSDECGNIDSCSYRVEVTDQSEPMVACDQRTIVSLNDDFEAKVPAQSFDDESFDGCSDITYQVRRMDGGCNGDTYFSDFIEFCCEDLGKTIMIELKVTDAAGYFSTCMAEAVVQFEGDILNVTCPENYEILDCRQFSDFDLNRLNPPVVVTDNACVKDLHVTPVITEEKIDACGAGYKDIDWTVPYQGEDKVICSERIVFKNTFLFNQDAITWPADRTVHTCDDIAPTPSELSNLLPDSLSCANVVYSEPKDQEFNNIANACVKILRKWTVVDWCRYPGDPSAAWTYIQTIVVKESAPPAFDPAIAEIEINIGSTCNTAAVLSPMAEDDCTVDEELKWTRKLERVSGSSTFPLIKMESGKKISADLDYGDYLASWTVTDACGSTTTAQKAFSISDTNAPVAKCKDFQTSINALTEVAIISATDINDGSYDGCGDQVLLGIRRAGTTDTLSSQILLTCDDVGSIDMELVVEDAEGNVDRCVASVTITDPAVVCAPAFFGDILPCGRVLDFDGDDDYVTVPSLTIAPAFTIEAYIYPEVQDADFVSLFEYGEDSPFIGFEDNRLTIFGQVKDDQEIPLNTWTHVAFSYNPSDNKSAIYINGVLSELGTASTIFEGQGFALAKEDSGTHYKGKMDEVRIWNRALTGQEIKAHIPTIIDRKSADLEAYYDFNAVAGVLIDRTDHAHVGTLHGFGGANPLPQWEEAQKPCPPDGSGANLDLTGRVATEDNVSIENASMTMTERGSSATVYGMSNTQGDFVIHNVKSSIHFELSANKKDDLSNGVNVADLIMLRRHILGLSLIDSPYRLIAADLNKSGHLSISDLTVMQHIILGREAFLQGQDAWSFIPRDYAFSDPSAPFDYLAHIRGTTPANDMSGQDFIGIKMGDINGTARANSLQVSVRAHDKILLRLEKKESVHGIHYDVIADSNVRLAGLQLNLSVESQRVKVTGSVIGEILTHSDGGQLSVLWSAYGLEAVDISEGDILFTISPDGGQVDYTKLKATDAYGMAVDDALVSYDVDWTDANQIDEDRLIVAQNIPNPFSERTSISFENGKDTEVSLSIYSIDGLLVYNHRANYARGKHIIEISRDDIQLNKGIYYYQIKTHNRSLVRKMIVL